MLVRALHRAPPPTRCRVTHARAPIEVIGTEQSGPASGAADLPRAANTIAYRWVDAGLVADLDGYLGGGQRHPRDLPVVIAPSPCCRVRARLTWALPWALCRHAAAGAAATDVVVVRRQPAGLAAGSLRCVRGPGCGRLRRGRAWQPPGTSSRIENYTGFPNGISGGDLTARAAVQAMRLGARLNAPCEAVSLRHETSFHVVTLRDGSEIPARAVIVASGARYRRLPVEELERFEGAGVYYAATDLEARVCAGTPVVVVGGGNSAGQAAIYLAQNGCKVTIAVRRGGLAETMSSYLIERIEADPSIDVVTGVEVARLEGHEHLEGVALRELASGEERLLAAAGLFSFIGADPTTGWLGSAVVLDEDGFVLTDRQLADGRDGATALPFETSMPGVFAAGDVRHGSMKRVAAAVGEGSSAVRSVHQYLDAATRSAAGRASPTRRRLPAVAGRQWDAESAGWPQRLAPERRRAGAGPHSRPARSIRSASAAHPTATSASRQNATAKAPCPLTRGPAAVPATAPPIRRSTVATATDRPVAICWDVASSVLASRTSAGWHVREPHRRVGRHPRRPEDALGHRQQRDQGHRRAGRDGGEQGDDDDRSEGRGDQEGPEPEPVDQRRRGRLDPTFPTKMNA